MSRREEQEHSAEPKIDRWQDYGPLVALGDKNKEIEIRRQGLAGAIKRATEAQTAAEKRYGDTEARLLINLASQSDVENAKYGVTTATEALRDAERAVQTTERALTLLAAERQRLEAEAFDQWKQRKEAAYKEALRPLVEILAQAAEANAAAAAIYAGIREAHPNTLPVGGNLRPPAGGIPSHHLLDLDSRIKGLKTYVEAEA
jgi:hypothetical protein